MNQEFKDAFAKLEISEKRNQLSNELIIIGEIIKKFENLKGFNNPSFNVKNYNAKKHSNLNESEILDFFYEDVYLIKEELITLLSLN